MTKYVLQTGLERNEETGLWEVTYAVEINKYGVTFSATRAKVYTRRPAVDINVGNGYRWIAVEPFADIRAGIEFI